ncbi:glutathione ABC transporter substrate-binding protein [Bhargavaea beijingensis]|uniref:Glutathione ABC transporter substrate-binding protein n=1 Tax=Bhargavaea beijingensis TaxID=426756 RepID=A0A1G7G098_9BACL|nr:glutathione ABC transporter substrate-binding protein [Bhargavaea beijingensis]MCW1927753.1 glutathione ABC transporter substrate-binding protein [Bhargavaea beijingensis]RSK24239.1 glutathione ABC transporter substrate-binding protein [Bhargavaea beijingensis]SDE81548.1 peptide/nickel transport system substrate-binding protein [Bhargavaea beijingensis]
MRKSRQLLLIPALMLSMLLTACAGGGQADTGNNAGNGEGEAAAGGDLILAVLSDASTLDPQGSNDVPSNNIHNNLFDTLVELNGKNEIVPSLATEWEMVDETTWEFKLREGVKFHDGTNFTAEAVKKTFDRVRDPDVASGKAYLYEMIESVEVIDQHTVQIKTAYPFSPLLSHLSHSGGSIISPKLIDEDYAAMESGEEPGAAINEHPVGTGFFKFESWEPGVSVKLAKNEDYWDGAPNVDTVTFNVIPESATRLAELETGNAHIIDPLQPNEVAQIESGDYATVNKQLSRALSFVGFNTEKEPFNDVRVRQAISMMIDNEEIVNGIYDGHGVPAKGPLAPGTFAYNESIEGLGYNPEKAKQLLEEAGYADGFSTTLITNDNPQRIDIAVLLQQKLKELNIDVKVEQMEFGSYLEKLTAGDQDMYQLGWSNATGDADNGLYSLFHSTQKGTGANKSFYGNPEVDKLLDAGRAETDEAKRKQIYNQLQQILIEEAPIAYIHHQEYLAGVANSVQGFSVDPSGYYQLKDVTLSE